LHWCNDDGAHGVRIMRGATDAGRMLAAVLSRGWGDGGSPVSRKQRHLILAFRSLFWRNYGAPVLLIMRKYLGTYTEWSRRSLPRTAAHFFCAGEVTCYRAAAALHSQLMIHCFACSLPSAAKATRTAAAGCPSQDGRRRRVVMVLAMQKAAILPQRRRLTFFCTGEESPVIVVDDAEALSVERLEGMATRSAAAAPAKRLSDQGVSLFAPTGKVTFL